MAEDSSQEKSEEPTQRKLERAKEKGQVPRSREMGTASVLTASAVAMFIIGPNLAERMMLIAKKFLTVDRSYFFDPMAMLQVWSVVLDELAVPLLGFILMLFLCGFLGNILIGGITFSSHSIEFKFDKLSPLRGFKRMFGSQGLIELIKSLAKVILIISVVGLLLYIYADEILYLSHEVFDLSVEHALSLLLWMFIILCSSMILIVSIDAPFQMWKHQKEQRMTKQEIKDERKNTDGSPEVKSRIRRLQQEISQRRMLQDLPDADVVIVNPEHYAVAVKYDLEKAKAPYILAKGVDHFAFKIRTVAVANNIPIVVSARLSRALYYSTRINQQIPDLLFTAVAQVLAYVYQLNQFNLGRGRRPAALPQEFSIPDEISMPDEANL
jgi:flagellar biosynthesis protein FlhB